MSGLTTAPETILSIGSLMLLHPYWIPVLSSLYLFLLICSRLIAERKTRGFHKQKNIGTQVCGPQSCVPLCFFSFYFTSTHLPLRFTAFTLRTRRMPIWLKFFGSIAGWAIWPNCSWARLVRPTILPSRKANSMLAGSIITSRRLGQFYKFPLIFFARRRYRWLLQIANNLCHDYRATACQHMTTRKWILRAEHIIGWVLSPLGLYQWQNFLRLHRSAGYNSEC